MVIKQTIWTIEPHTHAKHVILDRYLKAWLPIMSSVTGRIVYIDGFAGPGKYLDEKSQPIIDGSPLIALNAAIKHKLPLKAEIIFLFIESHPERCNYLKNLLSGIPLPDNIKYEVKCSKFDETLTSILNNLDEQKKYLAPTFAFIDPFGYSDTPFTVIKRIMENPKCEVLITFMYSFIKRAIAKPNQEKHLDILFGNREWRNMLDISTPLKKREFAQQLYKKQLEKEAKIKYVRFFEMINRFNQTEYLLFFGSNNKKGLKEMKRAMWKVDPGGAYRFSDRTDHRQKVLFEPEPAYNLLKKLIVEKFDSERVSIEQIEEFVVVDTPFRETHFKQKILKPMEDVKPPEIAVSGRMRKGTYPPGTVIQFL
jgi:three-Cys-motif partner protein